MSVGEGSYKLDEAEGTAGDFAAVRPEMNEAWDGGAEENGIWCDGQDGLLKGKGKVETRVRTTVAGRRAQRGVAMRIRDSRIHRTGSLVHTVAQLL